MMPRGDGGVVDPKLKVYGTANVRVVHASVFPFRPDLSRSLPLLFLSTIIPTSPLYLLSYILAFQLSSSVYTILSRL